MAAGQLFEENMVPLQTMNSLVVVTGQGDAAVISAGQTRIRLTEDDAPPRYSSLVRFVI